jgi:ribosomal-protein-serine acetyltransferase
MFSLTIDDELSLGLLELRHAKALHDVIQRNRSYLARWLPWALKQTPADTEAFIRRGLEQFARGDGFQAGIYFHRQLVGVLGTHYLNWTSRATEIGYWLAEAYQGRGLMTRTVYGACRYFFDELGLNRVEIRCDPANARSRAIPERLGFSQEGVLRQAGALHSGYADHVVYSLLAHEWQARQEKQS